ncbi:acyl-CoA N-acyltransferase [Trichoderma sp. SZMC 28014]
MAVLSQNEMNRGPSIKKATVEDLSFLQTIVNASYSKYIERIGKPPAPMLLNYTELPKDRDIFVLESFLDDKGPEIVGGITLVIDDASSAVKISNVVVGPAAQGRGLGRVLMEFAESVAREKGIDSLELYRSSVLSQAAEGLGFAYIACMQGTRMELPLRLKGLQS